MKINIYKKWITTYLKCTYTEMFLWGLFFTLGYASYLIMPSAYALDCNESSDVAELELVSVSTETILTEEEVQKEKNKWSVNSSIYYDIFYFVEHDSRCYFQKK